MSLSRRLAHLDRVPLTAEISALGLTTRAGRCLLGIRSIEELVQCREDELMQRRSFGRACLTDLRARLTCFLLDGLDVPEDDPMRIACLEGHPAVRAVWEAPAQPRPLGEVMEETLELLARVEQLRSISAGRARAESVSGIELRGASLRQLSEFVFAGLKPRERQAVEGRFAADGAELSLAEMGRRLGLTRERVRQLLGSAICRLRNAAERHRRAALTGYLESQFESAGGVLREEALRSALRTRFGGRAVLAVPLARALLEGTPCLEMVRPGLWCRASIGAGSVRAWADALHLVFREGQRPLTPRHATTALRRLPSVPPPRERVIRACLGADPRFCSLEAECFGLLDWRWGVPKSPGECAVAVLRTLGQPASVSGLTVRVNGILPPERAVAARSLRRALEAHPEIVSTPGGFVLREWSTP